MVLEARSLACERGGREVFRDLDFSVKSGEALELRGPNGSGKSSLLRLLAGLNKYSKGTFTLTSVIPDTVGEHAHYIGHQEATKSALSVQENLAFWSTFLSGEAFSDLKSFRLDRLADDEARLLSEGQRRRLALSRLVAVKRPLWLLDEPTVGLDQTALTDLRREMTSHLAQGGLIIAATHAALGLPGIRSLELGAAT
ncbi:heme ABC exporter ATP-binding protein CcmA [Aestuariivirga litoralis]|nr:heme ABC exporter ATP-binding protein CcmA [Aestuariivirga litoralis]MBG1233656.1 heme ABC exporter ATP-binding protein CcmA [Aestuariivirga litoralis]